MGCVGAVAGVVSGSEGAVVVGCSGGVGEERRVLCRGVLKCVAVA